MTLAEKWLQEGKIEGAIETIEKLLKMQVTWSFSEEVTGIDQHGDQELKEQR